MTSVCPVILKPTMCVQVHFEIDKSKCTTSDLVCMRSMHFVSRKDQTTQNTQIGVHLHAVSQTCFPRLAENISIDGRNKHLLIHLGEASAFSSCANRAN